MNKLLTVFSIALTTAFSAEAAATKKPTPADEVSALERQLIKDRKPFRERATAYQALLAEPRIATNYQANLRANMLLARTCLMGSWTNCSLYDYSLIGELYPAMMPKILDGDYRDDDKVWFVESYVKYFASVEKYDEGVAMVKGQIEKFKSAGPKIRARLKIALAEMYRLADRYDEAIAAAKDAMSDDNDAGASEGARIADAWQREDVRREFILKMTPPFAAVYVCPVEANCWQREVPAWISKRLSDFVLDASKPAVDRLTVFDAAFARDISPLGEKMMAAMLALPDKEIANTPLRFDVTVAFAYSCGNWARTAKLYELAQKSTALQRRVKGASWRRVYLTSLYAGGRKEDAIRLAGEYAADEKETDKDRAVYAGFRALFADEPIEPAVAGLATTKDKAEALQSVGRCAMTVSRTDTAEKLAKTYDGYFKPRQVRKMNVMFSEEPVRSISDWRRIYPKLEKGRCDLPFGEGLNFADLVTDVTTKREINARGEGDTLDVDMEMTCVADRYALHLFLRAPDPKARDVEHGFVNGITTEMYFAPGLEEPYICFGSNPHDGVTFSMNMYYDSLENRRIETREKGGNLQSEVAFSDSDYVLHVTLPWNNFYRKLPQTGTEWKFDCIAWAPNGPRTWGGSRGIHHSSDWGHLVFNLKPSELTAIKRELILANYRSWSRPKPTGYYRPHDWFEQWTERRIGDRVFYDTYLKDRAVELKALQAKVDPKMDDATVNEVYDKGLIHWLGIRHELDLLRAKYLADGLLQGKDLP